MKWEKNLFLVNFRCNKDRQREGEGDEDDKCEEPMFGEWIRASSIKKTRVVVEPK